MSKVLVYHNCRPRYGHRHRQGGFGRCYKVIATGRNTDKVVQAVRPPGNLLVVKVDVTKPSDAESALKAAVDRFGRVGVVVNNAGNFYAGFFGEIRPEDFRAQIETNLFGSVNVTRAVLPFMRGQRSALIVQISSTGGISGPEFISAYAASKFAVESWVESLTPEITPFGIRTMLVAARLLPHRAAHRGVNELSEALDQPLR